MKEAKYLVSYVFIVLSMTEEELQLCSLMGIMSPHTCEECLRIKKENSHGR